MGFGGNKGRIYNTIRTEFGPGPAMMKKKKATWPRRNRWQSSSRRYCWPAAAFGGRWGRERGGGRIGVVQLGCGGCRPPPPGELGGGEREKVLNPPNHGNTKIPSGVGYC